MQEYLKDPVLGCEVREYLKNLGLDNPIQQEFNVEMIEQSINRLIAGLGINTDDASISHTPKRVARFFIKELFYGLDYNNFPHITFNENRYAYHQPVICKNIAFRSTCEHHLVTISGHAYIAYIPKDHIVGLSKINRVVDFFARRPQIQERVTLQIFHTLQKVLHTQDVAVIINATHHCITMRGVSDSNVENMTYQFGGAYLDALKQRELFEQIKVSPCQL